MGHGECVCHPPKSISRVYIKLVRRAKRLSASVVATLSGPLELYLLLKGGAYIEV